MDEKIHSIEKLLFVLLKRHTAFNGQFSIGVHRRFCGREFAPSGDKPPPADAPYAIGLLNVLILRALILYQITKSAACFIGGLVTGAGRRHLPVCFRKKQIGGTKIAGLSQK